MSGEIMPILKVKEVESFLVFVCRHGSLYVNTSRGRDKPILLQTVTRVVRNPANTTPDFLHMFMFHTIFSTILTRVIRANAPDFSWHPDIESLSSQVSFVNFVRGMAEAKN
jgi:hypothetical protein